MLPQILVLPNKRFLSKEIKCLVEREKILESNIFYWEPDGVNIKIDQIREINSFVKKTINEKKIIVVIDFDTAKQEAQNAFLKTLEESTSNLLFVLVVKNISQVLPTVVSRCKVKKFALPNNLSVEFNFSNLNTFFQDFEAIEKDKFLKKCDEFIYFFRKKQTEKNIYLIIKEILKVKKNVEKNNINTQIAADYLLGFIQKNK